MAFLTSVPPVAQPSRSCGPRDPWRRPESNGFKEAAKALGVALVLSAPLSAAGGSVMYAYYADQHTQRLRATAFREAHTRLASAPALPVLPVPVVAHGRDLYLTTCTACHGPRGKGVEGLGKDLTVSAFVASLADPDLHRFLAVGRQAAVPMPPKGGNPDLTDADLSDVVAYLRGIQDPRRMPDLPPPVIAAAAPPSEAQKAAALAAAGGDAELADFIAQGAQVFAGTCVACHGKDARGLPGNGKDLVTSTFCGTTSDDDLLAFLKRGRDPGDPANTTRVGMPARGGNPALSDDDLLDVIAYLRSLQTASAK
ncbi:MAG: c-type cytochrome [Phycisphaerales bacterium]